MQKHMFLRAMSLPHRHMHAAFTSMNLVSPHPIPTQVRQELEADESMQKRKMLQVCVCGWSCWCHTHLQKHPLNNIRVICLHVHVQVRQELEADESMQKRKMLEATESIVAEYKKQMEAREAREREELALSHKKRVAELEEEHRCFGEGGANVHCVGGSGASVWREQREEEKQCTGFNKVEKRTDGTFWFPVRPRGA